MSLETEKKTFQPVKTLLLSGGEVHDHAGCADVISEILCDSGRFSADHVKDSINVFDGGLSDYRLLVFYYTGGYLPDKLSRGLLDWVGRGGGVAGIHSAADSFRGSESYRKMLGGYFLSHEKYGPFTIRITDKPHPVIRGITGRRFLVVDEMYRTDYMDDNLILAYSSGRSGDPAPAAWVRKWGKGRVFWLGLGHDPAACRDELFATLLLNGSLWVSGELE